MVWTLENRTAAIVNAFIAFVPDESYDAWAIALVAMKRFQERLDR